MRVAFPFNAGILRDMTRENKLIHTTNDKKQQQHKPF